MLTISTPADSADLVDLDAVKLELAIDSDDDDDRLSAWITQASTAIASQCRRTFGLESVTETIRLDLCQPELILSRFPVTEITSIVEGDDTLIESDYELNASAGYVTRLYGTRVCHWTRQPIVVTYSGGYTLPDDAPADLARACTRLVAHWRAVAERDPTLRSEAIMSGLLDSAYQMPAGALPPEVAGLIAPFKDRRLR